MTLLAPHFHVGVVVDDIEQGMDEVGRALGVSWGRVQRTTIDMLCASRVRDVEACYVYSLNGPPHLELIERRDDCVFEQCGLHHIGVWTNDPSGESARLDDIGWSRESVNVTADGTWAGALFHTGIGGLRIEVVDIARSGPRLLNYLGGGDYTLPS